MPMPTIWDVVVVGAGPSGVIAAGRLIAQGLRVLLLDGGPRLHAGQRTPEVDRRTWAFKASGLPYEWHRVRAVGGRALLWGGWSHRFPDVVFRRAGWPYESRVLAPHYAEVEQRLGVVEGCVDLRYRRTAKRLGVRISPKHGALRGADVWTPLGEPVARRAWTWAAARSLEHARGRATVAAVVDQRTGAVKRVRARAFVLAASPIETTRILLESELGVAARGIGHGLVDHMVASFVLIEPAAAPAADGRGRFPGCALATGFVNQWGRPERPYAGGFSIEMSGPVPLEDLGLERLVPTAELPRSRATLFHAIGEVFPHPHRVVRLHAPERDALGRPLPHVHLAWSREDRTMAADLRQTCLAFIDDLAMPGSRVIPFLDPLLPSGAHEAGTCAMGRTESSVCDPYGRLRALDNVWVADASAMPTAGDRHPTLTLLAHALRASDSVSRYLSSM